jgi:hypothetical protein
MDSDKESSESNCLICISPCKELSTDLFLYNCSCIYTVHKECFVDWRRVSKTNRVCIICHEELLHAHERRMNVIHIEPMRRMMCVNYIIVPITTVTMIIIMVVFMQYILTIQLPEPLYTKNIYLTNYAYNYDRNEL